MCRRIVQARKLAQLFGQNVQCRWIREFVARDELKHFRIIVNLEHVIELEKNFGLVRQHLQQHTATMINHMKSRSSQRTFHFDMSQWHE